MGFIIYLNHGESYKKSILIKKNTRESLESKVLLTNQIIKNK